jgi:hypothetical protein
MKYKIGSVIKVHNIEEHWNGEKVFDIYLHIHSHRKEGNGTICYQLSVLCVNDIKKCYERAERWYTKRGLNQLLTKKGATSSIIKHEDWNGVEAKLLLAGYTQLHNQMWNGS